MQTGAIQTHIRTVPESEKSGQHFPINDPKDIQSTQPFPTIPLPRRSLPCASLPLLSFEGLCHVFDLIPNIKAYIDRRRLLSRHRDTIAGPRIDLDDLLLLRFVLRAQDKPRKIGAALQVVDDYPVNLRSERSQYVC